MAASRIGFLGEAVQLFTGMLNGPHLPPAERERVARNVGECQGALSRVRVQLPPQPLP